jgi:hypothetical protein
VPYIVKADRKEFDPEIEKLLSRLTNKGFAKAKAGDLNYTFSKIVWSVFDRNPSYATGNELMGMLECVKQEFYRRKLAPYEEKKIEENGDIQ